MALLIAPGRKAASRPDCLTLCDGGNRGGLNNSSARRKNSLMLGP